jgi:hypothetical protein
MILKEKKIYVDVKLVWEISSNRLGKTNRPFQFIDKDNENEKHKSKKLVEVHSHSNLCTMTLIHV